LNSNYVDYPISFSIRPLRYISNKSDSRRP